MSVRMATLQLVRHYACESSAKQREPLGVRCASQEAVGLNRLVECELLWGAKTVAIPQLGCEQRTRRWRRSRDRETVAKR